MRRRLCAPLLLFAVLLPGARAQENAGPAPAHLGATTSAPIFALKTKTGQTQFHLGEMISIEEDYSAPVSGRYFLLTAPETLEGGYSSKLSIIPNESVIDRRKETGQVTAHAILQATCAVGVGSGGSVGASGPGQYALRPEPIHFPYMLNLHFQIIAPGHYTLTTRAANVVDVSDPLHVLPLTSNQLIIDVIRDDTWSHDQLLQAVDRLGQAGAAYRLDQANSVSSGSQDIVQRTKIELELENAAETIRFLDTEESLWQAVQLYDGSPNLGSYANPFFNGILESSHRDLAVRLLPIRMLQEDFLVSDSFLDLLTAMTLQEEQPIAFQQNDEPSRRMLNPRAREILRNYVLALGESLSSKRKEARDLGTKTFQDYASQRYCLEEPLIPEPLAEKVLQQARPQQTN